MEMSTPRQLLRSLGPLPETSPRTPELPRSPSMSFSSREAGWRTVLHMSPYLPSDTIFRNARLLIILFVRSFGGFVRNFG